MNKFKLLMIFYLLLYCDTEIILKNTVPKLTSLGPIQCDGNGNCAMYFTIRDYESEEVDIEITCYSKENKLCSSFEITGGDGTVGLTAKRDYPGIMHYLEFKTSENIFYLKLVLKDLSGNISEVIQTPIIDVSQGGLNKVIFY